MQGNERRIDIYLSMGCGRGDGGCPWWEREYLTHPVFRILKKMDLLATSNIHYFRNPGEMQEGFDLKKEVVARGKPLDGYFMLRNGRALWWNDRSPCVIFPELTIVEIPEDYEYNGEIVAARWHRRDCMAVLKFKKGQKGVTC